MHHFTILLYAVAFRLLSICFPLITNNQLPCTCRIPTKYGPTCYIPATYLLHTNYLAGVCDSYVIRM